MIVFQAALLQSAPLSSCERFDLLTYNICPDIPKELGHSVGSLAGKILLGIQAMFLAR